MNIEADNLLRDAFEVYRSIASARNPEISHQSPSWYKPTTAYDHAAAMCKALIAQTYGLPTQDEASIELVWAHMVDLLEVLSAKTVRELLTAAYNG